MCALNNLEQVFQTLSRVPADFNFDPSAGRASVSSASTSDNGNNNNGNGNEDGEEQGEEQMANHGGDEEAAEAALVETLANALDGVDVVAYTVLETLQARVRRTSRFVAV